MKILNLSLPFCIDYISIIFLATLLKIVGSVYLFGYYYLREDKYVFRFLKILTLFALSMIVLILCPHIIFVLLGYDGLGVIRFVLVVYYGRTQRWFSGLKTFLINRIGDGFFILGVMYLLKGGKIFIVQKSYISVWLFIILMVGWFTKSAQYPFSRWLPAAMAAPTPVSALVHSSTLVTAGVYLLIRLSSNLYVWISNICVVFGLITLFLASFRAIVEWDSKKIVAYSTLRQLGLMVYRYGKGLFYLCFFHLIRHAIFKALMFIVVGYLILKNSHFQDLRYLKNLLYNNIFLFIVLLLSVLSLRGFPFLIGFYSKDLILENYYYLKLLIHRLFILRLLLTSLYSGRLVLYLVYSKKKKPLSNNKKFWVIMSVALLVIFILVFGNYETLKNINIRFVTFKVKMLVLFIIMVGFFLVIKNFSKIKNMVYSWILTNISFLKVINSYAYVKYLTQVGKYFNLYLDHGLNLVLPRTLNLNNQRLIIFKKILKFSKLNVYYWLLIIIICFFRGLLL